MTLLICRDGLIGDFTGIIPVMIELAKQDELHVSIHPDAEIIFQLIPKKYNIQPQTPSIKYERILELDILKTYEISKQHNCYMSQAHFAYFDLHVPKPAPRAELEFELTEEPVYDYIIAPFSRSLPPEQLWKQTNWQKLVDMMPESSFCIIGHARDERNFITGPNITEMYNESLLKVMGTFKKLRKGVISIVSGPSHIAFHLGVKNYLLTNQPEAWGNNPDAIKICDYIPELKANKVAEVLRKF